MERINYGPPEGYRVSELSEIGYWINPGLITDQTILIGYMGGYVTDQPYTVKNCRVTPLNKKYGDAGVSPDMYDIEISAHIIRTLNSREFIKDFNPFARVSLIVVFSLLNVLILTILRTRWLVVNLIIATVVFVLLNALASLLVVIAFERQVFIDLDELTLILTLTTVFMVIINLRETKKIIRTAEPK